jgi:SpoVK/Ycf46/Vps4 family AAA+-type ATPase
MEVTGDNYWKKPTKDAFVPVADEYRDDVLPSGYYTAHYNQSFGYYFAELKIHTDKILELPSGIHKDVLEQIVRFLSKKEVYEKNGFLYKRGILLHGKPGSGKTCIINLICKLAIEKYNAIVFSTSDFDELNIVRTNAHKIEKIEKDRLKIIILEDIDCMLSSSSEKEAILLNFLDGNYTMENAIVIATTNYIENLPERILNRPSRFDSRIYVPFPTKEDRKHILSLKLEGKHVDIDRLAVVSEGYSFAHIMELVKLTQVLDYSVEEADKKIRELMNFKKENSEKYEKETKSIGF